MKIYRKTGNSLIFVQGEGYFDETNIVFAANGPDKIRATAEGDEVLDELWSNIMDEDGVVAGIDQAATLTYLNDQVALDTIISERIIIKTPDGDLIHLVGIDGDPSNAGNGVSAPKGSLGLSKGKKWLKNTGGTGSENDWSEIIFTLA